MSDISPLIDQSQIRLWLVCESGQRWLTASHRFAIELVPSHLTPNLISVAPETIDSCLIGQRKAIVFWEITPLCVSTILEQVTHLSVTAPRVLQIAAVGDLADHYTTTLSELGIRAMIEKPEQLPSLSGLVKRYFAE
jgi:hypothetical protein